tara:strand:- start:12 stop:614 length:603 start_codon:yes stop_codon:yes gene_type:complete
LATFYNSILNIAFIDVPLTSGIHVSRVLSTHIPSEAETFSQQSNREIPIHAGLTELQRLLKGQLFNYYTFAFVRNPFDWLRARYDFVVNRPSHPDYKRTSKLAFSDYIMQEGVVVPRRPQHKMLEARDVKVIRVAKSTAFGAVMTDILYELGVDVREPVSTPDDLKLRHHDSYTGEMVDHVSKIYEHDMRLFDFSFDEVN